MQHVNINQNIGQKQAKAIPTNDIIESVIQWAGEAPNKTLEWTGKFTTRWGGSKNDNFGFSGSPEKQHGTVFDYRDKRSQTFYLKGHNFKSKTIELPFLTKKEPQKNILAEFEKLNKPISHSYLKSKKISPDGLNIKILNDRLAIPIYNTEGVMFSWQTIDRNGKKLFKKDCPLGKGYHFPIGQKTDKIFVCEGMSTGASIHNITGQKVYCSFSKNNLDKVVWHCLKNYPKSKVILCLDNDGLKSTHRTKVNNNRLTVLCPDKDGDFNDHQKNDIEINKLKNLEMNWPAPMALNEQKNKQAIQTVTKNPDFKPQERVIIHNIIPRGYWITIIAETGVGKTTLTCHIIAKELKENPERKAYIYTQESDWSDNIAPAFLADGLKLDQIKKQIIYKPNIDYEVEKDQVLFDIKSLKAGDFVLIEPTPIISNNPNDSKGVPKEIQEYHTLAQEQKLYMFGLHHTTTGWSGSTLKEQGKFCKEWISYPRHTLIIKEKAEDGNALAFISKSNLMQRKGYIEFDISSKDIDIQMDGKKIILKNRPVVSNFATDAEMTTKTILRKYFKKEYGVEQPKRMKQSTEELRSKILKYIKDHSGGSPPKDHVLRQPLIDHCTAEGIFKETQVGHAIKKLKGEGKISISSGTGNRSQYRII